MDMDMEIEIEMDMEMETREIKRYPIRFILEDKMLPLLWGTDGWMKPKLRSKVIMLH